jgi:hypothetical protein
MLNFIFRYLLSTCLVSVCMCDYSHKSSYIFEIEMWNYMMCEYHKYGEYLSVLSYNFLVQSVCIILVLPKNIDISNFLS